MSREWEVCEVDPGRLASGSWCHQKEQWIGEGDIAASYSADRIGMGQPVRRPFSWRGGLWISTGRGGPAHRLVTEVYRVIAEEAFAGSPQTYAEKTRDAEAARQDPLGFYHGMMVSHGGRKYVVCGPPVCLATGTEVQPDLFSGLDRSASR